MSDLQRSDLHRQFEQAQLDVNSLAARPDNDTLLKLYALFKQATQGDASGERPGAFDFVRRAKFDAWSAMRGTPDEDAMRRYVELAKSLEP
jgi:diazepam-binding inhibitor (GABA receptor modulator, acyl-CoA-binding protein)